MLDKKQLKGKNGRVKVNNFENDDDYLNKESNSSTKVADIRGIVFGGIRSRFWMLRKHFNSMSVDELQNVPFHSWECLSIQLHDRDVDMVIKDPH